MNLDTYFNSLLEKLEGSDIQNNGKDPNGFFEPTRAMLFQRISLLRDLHSKPMAKKMVQKAWEYVVEHAPPEWLAMDDETKKEVRDMLA